MLRFSGIDPATRAFLQPDQSKIPPHYWRMPETQATPLEWMLECDRLNYLPEYILKKSDSAGMAHGLELRSPLLDHVLSQRVMGIRKQERFTNPPKGLMRQWLGVPEEKRRKMGFNPPLKEWFSSADWKDEFAELGSKLAAVTSGQLSGKALSAMVDGYRRGEIGEETIWQLVVLRRSIDHLTR